MAVCVDRKYLRDSERAVFAKQAFDLCFDVISSVTPGMRQTSDEQEKEKFLLDVHRYLIPFVTIFYDRAKIV